MVVFTFIRHGESVDNLKSVWAGWKDAPLSNHGMNQAKALGNAFSITRLTAIHSSDLQRAMMTAQALHDAQPEPQPPLTFSPLLREQNFGVAEGHPWVMARTPGMTIEEHYANDIYPTPQSRSESFLEGESLDDLERRANQAIEAILIPYILEEKEDEIHVAVTSHGLCISELLSALTKRCETTGAPYTSYRGLKNTAWTRVSIQRKLPVEGEDLQLTMQVIEINNYEHTVAIVRQKGGIGSSAHDPKQQDIRAFFGGDTTRASD